MGEKGYGLALNHEVFSPLEQAVCGEVGKGGSVRVVGSMRALSSPWSCCSGFRRPRTKCVTCLGGRRVSKER